MKKVIVSVSLFVAALLIFGGVSVAAKPDNNGGNATYTELQAIPKVTLGILVSNLNKNLATRLGIDRESGVVITRVQTGSPAEAAGLKVKDIIIAVNGTAVATVAEVKKSLPTTATQVTLTITRGSDTLTISATPAPIPDWAITTPPAWLPEMGGIKLGDMFSHNLGGQRAFLDKDGNKHTVTTTPGIVVEVKDNTITITPNGQTTPISFTTSDKTLIRVAGGNLSSLIAGDKVTVITVDNSNEARVVTSGARLGKRGFGVWGGPHKTPGQMKRGDHPKFGNGLGNFPKQERFKNKIQVPNPARSTIPGEATISTM